MDSIIRLSAYVNKVSCANPLDCAEEVNALLSNSPAGDIAVFPKLALCSPAGGDFLKNSALLSQCSLALEMVRERAAAHGGYVIVGVALDDWGKTVSAMAVFHGGELIALIPTYDNAPPVANGGYSGQMLPPETVFACGALRFCIVGGRLSELAQNCAQAARTGCELIVVPAYDPVTAGATDEIRRTARTMSGVLGCAIAVVNGGVGDTSSPVAYRGFIALYECGQELGFSVGQNESFGLHADLDIQVIRALKKSAAYVTPSYEAEPSVQKAELLRQIRRNPWLPDDAAAYLADLFELQAGSLAARMENIGAARLVIGVSGGLDSTAALLACVRAVDRLGLPRKNIIGVTMPGFGTGERTRSNADELLEKLGVTRRDISIRKAVEQHFADIGHPGTPDTAFENAQARERTQVLLDLANMHGAIVVGTGDLSEEALGFCTFAGDQMANYNVNVCITKTVLRELVAHIARAMPEYGVSDILRAILDTPVSPELLPPGENGEILQKTEEILGPYELHDFFLYHLVRYRFGPLKIYAYACRAFRDSMKPEYVKDRLNLFLQKFCAAQFKRSCAPDAASITEVNLCGVTWNMPSDLDPGFLLKELERIL